MWPSPVLYTWSPTLAAILVAARHAAPITCTPWDKETWFSTWTKDKGKTTKTSGFEFKPRQVNYSSQLNQGSDYLVSQSPPWWVHWQQKAQSLNFESKTHEAQLEDQKPKKSLRRSSRRRKHHKASKRHEKRQTKQKGKEELRKAQNSP
jgi:hypothetical protein